VKALFLRIQEALVDGVPLFVDMPEHPAGFTMQARSRIVRLAREINVFCFFFLEKTFLLS